MFSVLLVFTAFFPDSHYSSLNFSRLVKSSRVHLNCILLFITTQPEGSFYVLVKGNIPMNWERSLGSLGGNRCPDVPRKPFGAPS